MEWSRPGRHIVLSDSTGNPWQLFTQYFLSASDENQLAHFTWDGPMDCLPQRSGEKDRRASRLAELLQGKPSRVKQPAAETDEAEKAPLGEQGRAQDRRAEPGGTGTSRVSSKFLNWLVPISFLCGWSWKEPLLFHCGFTVSLLYEAKLTLLLWCAVWREWTEHS